MNSLTPGLLLQVLKGFPVINWKVLISGEPPPSLLSSKNRWSLIWPESKGERRRCPTREEDVPHRDRNRWRSAASSRGWSNWDQRESILGPGEEFPKGFICNSSKPETWCHSLLKELYPPQPLNPVEIQAESCHYGEEVKKTAGLEAQTCWWQLPLVFHKRVLNPLLSRDFFFFQTRRCLRPTGFVLLMFDGQGRSFWP